MLRIQLISNRFLCRYKLNICRYWDKPSTTQPHTTNNADADDDHDGFDNLNVVDLMTMMMMMKMMRKMMMDTDYADD